MPAAITIRESLTNFATYLLEKDLAITINPFLVSDDLVKWHSRSTEPFLQDRQNHSLANYLGWVRNGEFSIMLYDGALLQFTYGFDGERIISHRLAYIPCPFDDTDDILREADMDLFVEFYEAVGMSAVQFQSAVRFDFDPMNAKPGHPAAHLTINTSETRIACAGPVSPRRFVHFIFSHFYPHLPGPAAYFDTLPKSGHYSTTISRIDQSDLHINWTN